MAKKTILAKIYGVAEVPCVRTGKTDHVLDVAVGDYVYPLHITELWKEVKDERNTSDSTGSGVKNERLDKPALSDKG